MKNKLKQIGITSTLLVVAVVLCFGIYSKSKSDTNEDIIDNTEVTAEINVDDIEKPEVTVIVEDIDTTEIDDEEENTEIIDVEPPVVPDAPEKPVIEEDTEHEVIEVDIVTDEDDVVKEGDTEFNSDQPTYEEELVIEEKPIEDSVIVTPDVPAESSESNLVPDSENPFMQEPTQQDNGGASGTHDSSEYGDGEWGTGEKF